MSTSGAFGTMWISPSYEALDSPVSAPFQTVSPVVWPASCLSVVNRSRCSSRSVKYMPVWRMSEPGSAVMMSSVCLVRWPPRWIGTHFTRASRPTSTRRVERS